MKIKEWNFEKNLPANEMAFIAAKAEKRRADEGKETIFFRGDMWIGPERIENFKKRKLTATDMADLPVIIGMETRFLLDSKNRADSVRYTGQCHLSHPTDGS